MRLGIIETDVPGYTFLSSRYSPAVMVVPKRVGQSVEVLVSAPSLGPTAETKQINCVREATKDIEDPIAKYIAGIFAGFTCSLDQ